MEHEARSELEKNRSDIRQIKDHNWALLVTNTSTKPKDITVARQVVLRAMCETPVLLSSQVEA